ncbi:MAG: hypothetical protein OK457_06000 [Thaumarchaeota archaeon]|nr:hypothetical protein [Nitrososphaerota archaeon]
MPEKLPSAKIAGVKHDWLFEGLSYGEIAKKWDISSKSAVKKYIDELKQELPNIEELREHWNSLGANPKKFWESTRSFNYVQKLDDLGIGVKSLPVCVELAEKLGVDKAEAHINDAAKYMEVQRKTGKDPTTAVNEYNAAINNLGSIRGKVKVDEEKETRLKQSLGNLGELNEIKTKARELGVPLQEFSTTLDFVKLLRSLGFNEEDAKFLAAQLKSIGKEPKTAVSEIVRILRDHPSLDAAVASLKAEEKRAQQNIQTLNLQISEKKQRRDRLVRDGNALRAGYAEQLEEQEREIQELTNQKSETEKIVANNRVIIDLALAIHSLLRDPKTCSDHEFSRITSLISSAATSRQRGDYLNAQLDLEALKNTLANGIRNIPGFGFVARSTYEQGAQASVEATKMIADLMFPKRTIEMVRIFECPNCHIVEEEVVENDSRQDLRSRGSFRRLCKECDVVTQIDLPYLFDNFLKHPQWIPK